MKSCIVHSLLQARSKQPHSVGPGVCRDPFANMGSRRTKENIGRLEFLWHILYSGLQGGTNPGFSVSMIILLG